MCSRSATCHKCHLSFEVIYFPWKEVLSIKMMMMMMMVAVGFCHCGKVLDWTDDDDDDNDDDDDSKDDNDHVDNDDEKKLGREA